ncbi:hypothetical protein BD769DRAFT_1448016 [Suillus cothurnatus]|nr:hypothetical protein BD769DRAFT_1448016 [Suillus cothurnatus]
MDNGLALVCYLSLTLPFSAHVAQSRSLRALFFCLPSHFVHLQSPPFAAHVDISAHPIALSEGTKAGGPYAVGTTNT